MADQTPTALDVLVAHQRQDISSCMCGWAELGRSFCQHQIDALDAAGFAIVRKPTTDAVLAAQNALAEGPDNGQPTYRNVAGALAAAEAAGYGRGFRAGPVWAAGAVVELRAIGETAAAAADGRTPDDRTKALVDRVRGLRAKYDDLADDERGTQSGGMARDFSDELCAALCEWEGRADRCDAAKSRSSTTSEGRNDAYGDLRYNLAQRAFTAPDASDEAMLASLDDRIRDVVECTCGRAWEGHPQPHSIICKAYPTAAPADGRTPDDLDESVIAEALRVEAEYAEQREVHYYIEGYTDDLAHAVGAALKGQTDG